MSDDVVEALHLLQLSDSSTKSHVDSLPVEILTCILNDAAFNFWTSSGTDDSRWKFTSDARREEIRLERQDLRAMASVCIRWRDVILRTPSFWSTISVDSRAWDTAKESMGANRVDPERLFALLALNLRRGSSHPLTLAIHADTDNSYFSVRILRFLALHSERWKDVSLWLTSNSACFLSRIVGRLPALERLRVEFTCTDDVNPPFDVFADAPRLRALELISTSKYLPTVPWAQLRTFKCVDNDLSCEALPHLGSALAKLTRTAHCALDLTIYDTGRGPDLEERIQCPLASLDLTLSRLWLMADDYELELPLFFEMFTFPNLCALALRTDQNDDCAISLCDRGLASFISMAHRSRFAANLTRLAILIGAHLPRTPPRRPRLRPEPRGPRRCRSRAGPRAGCDSRLPYRYPRERYDVRGAVGSRLRHDAPPAAQRSSTNHLRRIYKQGFVRACPCPGKVNGEAVCPRAVSDA